jgi:glutathione S-transferase
LDADLT